MKSNLKTDFILLDGMDLSGKSTILKEIKNNDQKWDSYHIGLSHDKSMYSVANHINRNGDWSAREIGYLYLAGLELDIYNFKYPTLPTIQDSCVLLRAFAHHSVYGNMDIIKRLEKLAEQHPKFSKSFVFTVDIKTRIKRLNDRLILNLGKVDKSDNIIITNPELFIGMDNAIVKYAKKYFQAEIINTANLSIQETVRLVLS